MFGIGLYSPLTDTLSFHLRRSGCMLQCSGASIELGQLDSVIHVLENGDLREVVKFSGHVIFSRDSSGWRRGGNNLHCG